MQRFCGALRKFVLIALAYCTLLVTCASPARGQQSSQSNNTQAFTQSSQGTYPAGGVQSAPSMATTPTPDGNAMRSTAQPGMGNDKMGAPGLIPPGIMVGQAGKWMVGYQVTFYKFDGNLVGTDPISNVAVLRQFAVAPTNMTMQMQMGTVMYSPTDKLTFMAMVPYSSKLMNHVTRDGTRFSEQTNGIGDIGLSGLYSLYAWKDLRHRLLLNAGIGLPTGSINRTMGGMRLEYPMQQGSGTVSLIPGFTYLGQALPWGWGAEFIPTLRVGRNSNGYRLGNRYQPSIWGARQLTPWLSLSARANGNVWQNIHGADAALNPINEPTKDPTLQGGRLIDFTFGMRLNPTEGFLKGHEFFVDADKPIFQSLDGPQLQMRWAVRLGWQWAF